MPKAVKKSEPVETFRDYAAEFNRVVGDSILRAIRELQKAGLKVRRPPHLTGLVIRRPLSMSWREFKDIIRSILQPRIGGVMLTSSKGRTFVCDNRGNQPGRFVRWM